MTTKEFIEKARRKIRGSWVRFTYKQGFNHLIYFSYWHSQIHRPTSIGEVNYFSARPNPGAGIGHQISNWIAGFWFAKYFDLRFAHIPFPNKKWEYCLGFGMGEAKAADLLQKGYQKVRLPFFEENKPNQVLMVKKIIQSYAHKNVVFVAEQDQFYRDHFHLCNDLKHKFYTAPARAGDTLKYSNNHCNIAIHIRRGDIATGGTKNPNLSMRWQTNDYFANVLRNALDRLKSHSKVKIYLFSQGEAHDFMEFAAIENLNLCLDMSAMDSFLHMVHADILITSKSSFSYKPALLCQGIKICPAGFWHGYPDSENWIIADENGNLNVEEIIAK